MDDGRTRGRVRTKTALSTIASIAWSHTQPATPTFNGERCATGASQRRTTLWPSANLDRLSPHDAAVIENSWDGTGRKLAEWRAEVCGLFRLWNQIRRNSKKPLMFPHPFIRGHDRGSGDYGPHNLGKAPRPSL